LKLYLDLVKKILENLFEDFMNYFLLRDLN
jgi:hypothetical protein